MAIQLSGLVEDIIGIRREVALLEANSTEVSRGHYVLRGKINNQSEEAARTRAEGGWGEVVSLINNRATHQLL